jgi:hypothetical protein
MADTPLVFDPSTTQQQWEQLTAMMNDILIQSRFVKDEGPEVQLHYQKVLEAKIHKLHQAYVKFHWEFLRVIDEKERELCPWKNMPSMR